jgi:pimeloyl-ACP methyl ester carboxylesterase
LLIWGEEDRIIPVAHGYAAHAALPGSRLEVLHGVGHFPHVEAPAAVVDILDDFIGGAVRDRVNLPQSTSG